MGKCCSKHQANRTEHPTSRVGSQLPDLTSTSERVPVAHRALSNTEGPAGPGRASSGTNTLRGSSHESQKSSLPQTMTSVFESSPPPSRGSGNSPWSSQRQLRGSSGSPPSFRRPQQKSSPPPSLSYTKRGETNQSALHSQQLESGVAATQERTSGPLEPQNASGGSPSRRPQLDRIQSRRTVSPSRQRAPAGTLAALKQDQRKLQQTFEGVDLGVDGNPPSAGHGPNCHCESCKSGKTKRNIPDRGRRKR